MIDQDYLQQLIDESLYAKELTDILGISENNDGSRDWGAFNGLNENCCISLGIDGFTDAKQVAEMLNAYKFPATTVEGADDVTKILVTSTGLQFPLRTPEEAVAELSDVLNVLKANGVDTKGYAHPKVAANMSKSEFLPSMTTICAPLAVPVVFSMLMSPVE